MQRASLWHPRSLEILWADAAPPAAGEQHEPGWTVAPQGLPASPGTPPAPVALVDQAVLLPLQHDGALLHQSFQVLPGDLHGHAPAHRLPLPLKPRLYALSV